MLVLPKGGTGHGLCEPSSDAKHTQASPEADEQQLNVPYREHSSTVGLRLGLTVQACFWSQVSQVASCEFQLEGPIWGQLYC